jgi:UDP-N-acetylglucosamine acyltransferase
VIGDRNTIREFCTFNLGCPRTAASPAVGDDNWIMAYVHIAHDCQVGNHTILANNATLAGHVHLGDWVTVGGLTGVHQFVQDRRPCHGGISRAMWRKTCRRSCWWTATRWRARLQPGGLRRRGFSRERMRAVKQMHKLLYRQGLTLEAARAAIADLLQSVPEAAGRRGDDGAVPGRRHARHRALTGR